jgi:two-component system, OmpR family, manganese sensing sensor histidine kinase
MVRGKGAELSRLFRNIIENALQYTPSGGTVSVTMLRERQNVSVEIKDTGVGIASENLASIFDRFWRADKARVRRAGGMGMGLAIARAIAEHHQGKISVMSQVGIGSCFTIKLPMD